MSDTPSSSSPSRKRVLVAEDNDMNYQLVEFVLSKQGLQVSRAATGPQALEMASAEPPDLVLMDIQLPGMNGLEVTRQLRRQAAMQGVPIVALTALAMAGDKERALAAGCDTYLAKPISPGDLIKLMRLFVS